MSAIYRHILCVTLPAMSVAIIACQLGLTYGAEVASVKGGLSLLLLTPIMLTVIAPWHFGEVVLVVTMLFYKALVEVSCSRETSRMFGGIERLFVIWAGFLWWTTAASAAVLRSIQFFG